MTRTVKPTMTRDPITVSPDATLEEAARRMAETDCGVLPVSSGGKAEGIITDRDIVIRAVARGKDVRREKVRDYMTAEVFTCNEDDTLEEAADRMQECQVARLVVTNDEGKMSGILTFGSMMRKEPDPEEISTIVQCALGRRVA